VHMAAEFAFRSLPVAFGAGLSGVFIVGHGCHATTERIALLIGAVVIRSHLCDSRGEGSGCVLSRLS
jgi:hypothetical protein